MAYRRNCTVGPRPISLAHLCNLRLPARTRSHPRVSMHHFRDRFNFFFYLFFLIFSAFFCLIFVVPSFSFSVLDVLSEISLIFIGFSYRNHQVQTGPMNRFPDRFDFFFYPFFLNYLSVFLFFGLGCTIWDLIDFHRIFNWNHQVQTCPILKFSPMDHFPDRLNFFFYLFFLNFLSVFLFS